MHYLVLLFELLHLTWQVSDIDVGITFAFNNTPLARPKPIQLRRARVRYLNELLQAETISAEREE